MFSGIHLGSVRCSTGSTSLNASMGQISPDRKRKREGKMEMEDEDGETVLRVKHITAMFNTLEDNFKNNIWQETVKEAIQMMMDGLYEALDEDEQLKELHCDIADNVRKNF